MTLDNILWKHRDTMYMCKIEELRLDGLPLPFLSNKIVIEKWLSNMCAL